MKKRSLWVLSMVFVFLAAICLTAIAAPGDQDIWVISTDPDIDIIVRETLAEGLSEPMTLQMANDGRIFFVQRGGAVKVWDEANGVQDILNLSTYTGNEHGLIGIALDPDFDRNNYIYLYYAPGGNHTENFLSRFELKETPGGTTYLDANSEVVLFKVFSDRATCCHQAGAIRFGPDGKIYLSTGDNTNPFESQGFAPIDRRPGREYFNALRTSSNPQDLRGKILRLNPDGSIPEDNPFVGNDEVHDAIYSLGYRNPFRFTVDPVTGWVLTGDVGPDSGGPNASRGPAGYDLWTIISEPGHHNGWPICRGPSEPYIDYDFATGQSGEAFDCSEMTPSLLWTIYGGSPQFPELQSGGRTALGGPILRDPGPNARYTWHERYLNKWFIYEYSRHYIKMVALPEDGTALPERANFYNENLASGQYGQVPAPEVEIENFINQKLMQPVELVQGPDGALYMLEYGNGRLSRIYNQNKPRPPVAMASIGGPWSGQPPLTVTFSAAGSYDVDGDGITAYEWNFGDGHSGSGETVSHTYTANGVYEVSVQATSSRGPVGESASVTVVVGNTVPDQPVIETPTAGAIYAPGSTVVLSGYAEDAEDGRLSDDSLSWSVMAVHRDKDGQRAIDLLQSTGASAEFGLLDDAQHNWHEAITYWISLTATDSEGLSATTTMRVRYTRIQAQGADEASQFNMAVTDDEDGHMHAVTDQAGAYLKWDEVAFEGSGPVFVRVRGTERAVLSLRQGSPNGEQLAANLVDTSGEWTLVPFMISNVEGTDDLYLVVEAIQGEIAVNWIHAILQQ